MEASYKMDEGYSEDTRSQDGCDSPMGMDSGGDGLLQSQIMSATGLSAAVLALSEAEKAGISPILVPCKHGKSNADYLRLCIQHFAYTESLVYS